MNFTAHKTNGKPFFSIIIPTRNRPTLVVNAIVSVLNQSYQDYEIIVSDNSDDSIATQNALLCIDKWKDNPRCRYIRPIRYMNMPDHWDFCTSHATGEYVAILTDRFVMRPSALEVLEKNIKFKSAVEPNVVLWNVQSSFCNSSGIQKTQPFTGKRAFIDSKSILEDFASLSGWRKGGFFFNNLPRGLNSIYRRSFADEVIDLHGRLFPPCSPDYSSAFLLLAYTKEILCLDFPFYMSHGSQSNGLNTLIYGTHTYDAGADPIEGCPLQIDTVFNSLVRDFLAIQTMVEPRMKGINIDMVGYFLSNYREIIWKELLGSPMDLELMYELWSKGVRSLPLTQQNEVEIGKRTLDSMRGNAFSLLRYKLTRRFGLFSIRDFILALVSKKKHLRAGGVIYHDVIEAAKSTDHFLK